MWRSEIWSVIYRIWQANSKSKIFDHQDHQDHQDRQEHQENMGEQFPRLAAYPRKE